MKDIKIILSVLGLLGSATLLWHMRNISIEQGLYADATGTGGYTTNLEIALISTGLVVFICSTIFLIKALTAENG